MEAIEFLKEYKRMCESMVDECSVCPMSFENNKHNVACSHLLKKCPEDACKIVEQWSKEHPIITNARKFEEVFGKIEIKDLITCRLKYDSEYYTELEILETRWWDEPYKEPEHEL